MVGRCSGNPGPLTAEGARYGAEIMHSASREFGSPTIGRRPFIDKSPGRGAAWGRLGRKAQRTAPSSIDGAKDRADQPADHRAL